MASAENDPRPPGVFWVFHLDWPTPSGLAPRLPATFVRLGPEAADTLASAMGLEDSSEVLRRFEAGRLCYAAQVEGALAAYGWVSFIEEQIGEIHLRVRLVPGEAYIWDCATLPAYRKQRLYTALLAHVLGELRAEGLCRAWIGTNQENVASQKGIALAGFQPVADVVVERVLAMRQVWVRGRPGVPEHIVEAARRVLLDDRDQAWLNMLSSVRRGETGASA
jgi:GNAT superfamily N-acetyltransferase